MGSLTAPRSGRTAPGAQRQRTRTAARRARRPSAHLTLCLATSLLLAACAADLRPNNDAAAAGEGNGATTATAPLVVVPTTLVVSPGLDLGGTPVSAPGDATGTAVVGPTDGADATTPTTQAPPVFDAGVTLTAEGFNVARFGADTNLVVETLTNIFGAPLIDSDWVGAQSIYGNCPGTSVRALEWQGVTVLFGDADDRYQGVAVGDTHFMSWQVVFGDRFRLRTAEGIGIGATREEVLRWYPAATGPGETDLVIATLNGEITGAFNEAGNVAALRAGTECT